jgi:tRNA (guanine37-N1)-methyltransferase
MRFDIITIFPRIFDPYLNESILKRAQAKKLVKIKIHNLRDFTKDKHHKVDDKPYGGGAGMVMQIQPIVRAVEFAKLKTTVAKQVPGGSNQKLKTKIILFTPSGKQFDNKIAAQLAKNYNQLILICGHYEGIDARTKKTLKASGFGLQELSIGPYVLTGGELPAMVLIDGVSRQIPGVLGKEESLEEKRFGIGVSAYTRPEIFVYKGKKYRVPNVLLSGNHKEIEAWRKKQQK